MLVAPKGMDTRPTLDQVRESLFNILQLRVGGTRVLDLYAGSGALALEALSRGAASAVLSDSAREAFKALDRNVQALGYQQKTRLLQMDDRRAIETLKKEGARFDIIFLDPPYRMDTSPILTLLLDAGLLETGGLIVVEHAGKTPPTPDTRLMRTDVRRYRETSISFFGRKTDGGNALPVSREL